MSYQHGTAVYNTAFSSAEGLQITFDYAAYGGNEADGISFFLIDGNTTNPTMGAHFGYLPRAPNVEPGVTNGYMGVVLNEYAGCDSQPPTVPPCQYDHVAVVGAGSLYGGFTGLHAVPLAGTAVGKIAPVDRARIVRVTISPVTPATLYPKVTVEIDPNDGVTGFVKLIDAFSLAGNGAVPKTFKMGFGASTGARKHIHEVRIRSAKTLVSAVPALEQSTLGALAVLLALLTLPALRRCLNG
ncbi:MAG: hypothetical protein LBP52_00760 [Burkholderiaceae bacterium]|nr:hypothetical protein [Burkholderiaceae bacterium]